MVRSSKESCDCDAIRGKWMVFRKIKCESLVQAATNIDFIFNITKYQTQVLKENISCVSWRAILKSVMRNQNGSTVRSFLVQHPFGQPQPRQFS
jgi:hypothetical protein